MDRDNSRLYLLHLFGIGCVKSTLKTRLPEGYLWFEKNQIDDLYNLYALNCEAGEFFPFVRF
jgi:hypothetical protein